MAIINLNNISDETVQGATPQADTINLTGRGSNVLIDAGGGNDSIIAAVGGAGGPGVAGYTNATIFGGAGNDVIEGFGSNSFLFGNQGRDEFLLTANASNMAIFGGQDEDRVTIGTGRNVSQSLFFGNQGADIIDLSNSTGGFNTVFGGQGSDTIFSSGGGNDFLSGDLGDDYIIIGQGSDNTTAFGGEGADTIEAIGGSDNLLINGNQGSDLISLDAQGGAFNAAVVFGGQGADQIAATGLVDSFVFGNLGDDLIEIGAATDLDGADATTNTSVFGGQGNDIITLANGAGEGNLLSGDLGDDIIDAGTNARTTVLGGEGNDIITASGAGSVLTGGSGRDRFNVAGVDVAQESDLLTITDFVTGVDQIDLGGPTARSTTIGQGVVNGGFDAVRAAAGDLLKGDGIEYAFVTNGTDGYLFRSDTSVVRLQGIGSVNGLAATDILSTATI